jgi:DNA ligase (NAD+)
MSFPKVLVNKLIKEIKKYNNAYYNENKSLVSDFEYDMKLKELQRIAKEFPEVDSSS